MYKVASNNTMYMKKLCNNGLLLFLQLNETEILEEEKKT
jgi:hypothetical protein